MSTLRVAAVMESSRANGPGLRFVVWTQGCPLGCPGCQNPETWPAEGGALIAVDELVRRYARRPELRGLTLSGGEPFAQAEAAATLAEAVVALGGDVVTFSGYTLDELEAAGPMARRLLRATDLLIDGRYEGRSRIDGAPMLGSSNQSLRFLSGRVQATELAEVPPAEWVGGEDGALVTGVAARRFAAMLQRGGAS